MTPRPLEPSTLSFAVDLHCDSILAHARGERDIGLRSDKGHLDIPRMKEGGVRGQVFAIWVEPKLGQGEVRSQKAESREQSEECGAHAALVEGALDALLGLVTDRAGDIGLALRPAEFEDIVASGRIGAIAGIEGGHALEGRLERLEQWFERGVRVLTMTWFNSNELADGGFDESQPHKGISALGRQAVRRMNELGMIVDVSHCSERAFFALLDASDAPAIASHSGVAALYPHRRNLTDAQIRRLAENGGMMGMTFVPAFLGPDEGKDATVADVVAGIDHVCQLVGPAHVGLGSDFDGFDAKLPGLEDCTKLGAIERGLCARGYPEAGIRQILSENFVRVWRAVAGRAVG